MPVLDKTKYIALFTADAADNLSKLNNGLVELEKNPQNKELIIELNRQAHNLKGSARIMGFTEICDLAHQIESCFEAISSDKASFDLKTANQIFSQLDGIRKRLDNIRENGDETVNRNPEAVIQEEYLKIPLSRINKLVNLVGELVINKTRSEYNILNAKKIRKLARETRQRDFDMQRLNEEIDSFYESISSEAIHADPVIKELKNISQEMRLLPAATVFDVYPRMVRDLAVSQKKNVDFEITGRDVEIDKKILEEINPALIHLLRNSVDHGIHESGRILLSLWREAGEVVIEVADNGDGLDFSKIKETALKKRLANQEDLENMSKEKIIDFIFLPGFSTSPIITSVSGRGVGMDVVDAQVKKLRGKIEVESNPGQGTAVILRLPMNVAIIQALIVSEYEETVAFPMPQIEETIKIQSGEVKTLEGKTAFEYRGHAVPLVKLGDELNLPRAAGEAKKEKILSQIHVVIVQSVGKKIGFMVDEIIKKEEIFIKPLGKHLGKIKNIEGAAILGNGQVILVLDIIDLFEDAKLIKPEERILKALVGKKAPGKILVVEDALITRELECSILSASGYEVEAAVDGVEAIDKISRSKPDLIVTDIEMPRMNGFEMCRALKKNDEYKDIPVVIITAHEKEEDKRRGIEAGADAYITKSAFDQNHLMDTIERLIG